jgi:hypothetical protein
MEIHAKIITTDGRPFVHDRITGWWHRVPDEWRDRDGESVLVLFEDRTRKTVVEVTALLDDGTK